jgi:predicted nucleic acid-binding protein
MMAYGLASNDAIHGATAAVADVKDMATMDFHFSAVPASLLRLWVPDHRVRVCRQRRA